MVENAPQARPQTGLDQADIVYEILAEGEITRFVSVFQSHEATTIGPVRSIRPYFVEIGDALDAVIVHAGWSQEAMDMMAAASCRILMRSTAMAPTTGARRTVRLRTISIPLWIK